MSRRRWATLGVSLVLVVAAAAFYSSRPAAAPAVAAPAPAGQVTVPAPAIDLPVQIAIPKSITVSSADSVASPDISSLALPTSAVPTRPEPQTRTTVTTDGSTSVLSGSSTLPDDGTTTSTSAPSITLPATGGNTAPAAPARLATVVLSGGCFWGVQGVFEHVRGVTMAQSGYAGGSESTASYPMVSTGTTGHAESVRVTFDTGQVTFGQILQVFFSVVHDPTELDEQGPDVGPQYRSAIFAQDTDQQRVAQLYVDQLTRSGVFAAPIVTQISVNTDFFPAEAYHQDFLNDHPDDSYIATVDVPKVEDLEKKFPQLYRERAVLVFAGTP